LDFHFSLILFRVKEGLDFSEYFVSNYDNLYYAGNPQETNLSMKIALLWIFFNTLKPVYLEHVDNWFLKLVLYYFNKYIFKNHLSTCSR
jgi:hypothetical protein